MKSELIRGEAMTRISLGLLALLLWVACSHHQPAWEKPPPRVQAAPVVAPGALHRATLDNGLTILILEDHRLPRVALDLTVRRGAGAVQPDQAGLAAFTAELMNRGAGDSNAMELAERVDDLGAGLSVVAGWDAMDVGVSGLSGDLGSLFEILRDVVLSPRFEDGEAEKARSEQLAGLAATRDDPASLAGQSAMRVLYPEHRYGLPLEGTPSTVKNLRVQDARSLHAR
ncbi:insulinase family protein, partial [Myxococcota bacterium]|nr:insulinase family protein [Myxococcota bacterium]